MVYRKASGFRDEEEFLLLCDCYRCSNAEYSYKDEKFTKTETTSFRFINAAVVPFVNGACDPKQSLPS